MESSAGKHVDETTPLQKSGLKAGSRDFAVLAFCVFLKGGIMGAYVPFAALWLSRKGYGARDLGLVALVDAVFSLMLPLAGATLDKLKAHNNGFVFLLMVLAALKLAYIPAQGSLLLLLLLTAVTAPILRAANAILDALVLFSCSEKGDFPKIRMFGDLGFGLISVVVGIAMQITRGEDVIFVIFAAACAIVAFTWYCFAPGLSCIRPDAALEHRLSTSQFARQVVHLSHRACSFNMIRALTVVGIVGGTIGIVATYEFVLLDDMLGSGVLLGVAKLTGSVMAIPVWFLIIPVMDRIGFKNLQLIALSGAGLRLAILGSIKNPWHVLFSEALSGLGGFAATYSMMSVLLGRTVDESMKGTAQTLVFAIFNGIGYGFCPLLASFIVEIHGLQTMFTICAKLAAVLTAVLVAYDLLSWFALGTYKTVEDSCLASDMQEDSAEA